MCLNLNKSCPKNDFPLVRIDQIVDSAASNEMMAMLDCFSGYLQIWLRPEDEEKTDFITPFRTYYYLRMPKGLHNTGPTFCRTMKATLKDQVRRNILYYVDDIVVVTRKKENYISGLAETFTNMREAKLKLNPKKCVFGITRGKVLGCLITTKGIEANPDKIRAITQMQPLHRRKDVEKLTGRIASLNRFISKLAERSLPFFTVLRGSARIQWGAEQRKAFESLKSYLEKLPMLSSPEQGQPLILYISVTHAVVIKALVVEKEVVSNSKAAKQKFQCIPFQRFSQDPRDHIQRWKKICYAVVMSASKLRHYFDAHTIKFVTNQPMNDIFGNKDSSGRISK
jgi:hypothetical protein